MTFANPTTTGSGFGTGVNRPDFSSAFAQVTRWISQRWALYVERRSQYYAIHALRRLDDHMLRDIGIDRSEIVSAVTHGRRGREITKLKTSKFYPHHSED